MSSYKIVGGDRQEYGPVDESQVRQWIAEGRANGETVVQAEGGVWKKLSQHPEFADALLVTGPPTLPPPPPVGVPPGAPLVPGSTDPKSAVLGPAIALLATAIMDLAMTVFSLLAGVMGWGAGMVGQGFRGPQGFNEPEIEEFFNFLMGPMGIASNVFGLVVNAVILVAALRMMSLNNYGLCMVAAVLAVIPCTAPCCCLGIAAGVWALVVLTRPEVKQSFL